MLTRVLLASGLAIATLPATAGSLDTAARSFYESQVMVWATDAVILDAVTAQNSRTAGLSNDEILALDQAWRAEVGTAQTPTISPVLDNAASEFLRAQMASAGGAITEVFVMDAQGLNVAASGVTSDYWQGDEAKHQETFGVGANAVHVGEVEFDESAQEYLVQVSVSLTDASGAPVGAITVGVLADALM